MSMLVKSKPLSNLALIVEDSDSISSSNSVHDDDDDDTAPEAGAFVAKAVTGVAMPIKQRKNEFLSSFQSVEQQPQKVLI